METFPVDPDCRFNFYVQRWNKWPDYPVYLWSSDGKRSVPGQILNEAGVRSDFLVCDDDMPIYGKRLRYLSTHVVPDDVVAIRSSWKWIGGKVVPSTILEQHPPEGEPLPVPMSMCTQTVHKVWNVLIELNDRGMYIDRETGDVVESVPWQTRAYWIRETLRHFGVGISFRHGNR